MFSVESSLSAPHFAYFSPCVSAVVLCVPCSLRPSMTSIFTLNPTLALNLRNTQLWLTPNPTPTPCPEGCPHGFSPTFPPISPRVPIRVSWPTTPPWAPSDSPTVIRLSEKREEKQIYLLMAKVRWKNSFLSQKQKFTKKLIAQRCREFPFNQLYFPQRLRRHSYCSVDSPHPKKTLWGLGIGKLVVKRHAIENNRLLILY